MLSDSLRTYVDRFVSLKDNPRTRSWYRRSLAPALDYFGEDRPLDSITRRDAEAFWAHVHERNTCWEFHPSKPTEVRPPAPTTLDNYLRAARCFWNEMVRQQQVEYNPFGHIPRAKDDRPVDMKAIHVEDLKAIWHAARRSSKRDYAIVTTLATTGIRAGELVSMTTSRLNLKRGEAWVHGKRGWRQIFLGQTCVDAVQAYVTERPTDQGPSLWLSHRGGQLTEDGVRQMIYRLVDGADVSGRHNLHAFRHRFAQSWLDNGVIPELVAQALGHADVAFTLSVYGNQDQKRVRKAARKAEMAPFIDMFADEIGGIDLVGDD